ncbi:hypothetical protein ACEQ8H_007053 [Pleosporales sp. CAS-2024a]
MSGPVTASHVPQKPTKTVRFTEGTSFGPSRPQSAYLRRSPGYSPGHYCCPNEDGWEDTSMMKDLAWQLQHRKVACLRVDDKEGANAHKTNFKNQISAGTPVLAPDLTGLRFIHEYMSDLVKAQDGPWQEALDKVMTAMTTSDFPIQHADYAISYEETGTGKFLTSQWIIDTAANREATSFMLDERRSIPKCNRGQNRQKILSRIQNGLL